MHTFKQHELTVNKLKAVLSLTFGKLFSFLNLIFSIDVFSQRDILI